MTVLARLLAVVAALLLPLALTASWVERTATDTDDWVAATARVPEDPEVRVAVARRVEDVVVRAVVEAGVPAAALQALGGEELLARAVRDAVDAAVASDALDRAWRAGNRDAHRQLVRALESPSSSEVVRIDLALLVEPALEELRASGLPLPELEVPAVGFVVATPDQVDELRPAYDAVDGLGTVVPLVVLGLVVVALLPRGRRGTLLVLGVVAVPAFLLARVAADAGVDELVTRAGAGLPSQDRTVLVEVADAVTAGLRSDLVVGAGVSLAVVVVLVVLGAVGRAAGRGRAA